MNKINVILGNLETVFRSEGREATEALRDMSEHFSVNDHHAVFKRDCGHSFNPDDVRDLLEAYRITHSDRFRQWCLRELLATEPEPGEPDHREHLPEPSGAFNDGWTPVGVLRGNVYRIAAGFTRDCLMFLQSDHPGVEVAVQDRRVNHVGWKAVPLKIGSYSLRPDQVEAVRKLKATMEDPTQHGGWFHNAMFDLAVNTGKTLVVAAVVAALDRPRVMLPFREKLLAARAVADYMELGFSVAAVLADRKQVVKVLRERGIDQAPLWGPGAEAEIIVCMVQTLRSMVTRGEAGPQDFDRVNCLIFDECDSFAGDESRNFLELFRPGLVLGMSGTPLKHQMPSDRARIKGMFGGHRYRVTTADNISKGVSLRPEVMFNLVRHDLEKVPVGVAKRLALKTGERLEVLTELLDKHVRNRSRQVVLYFGQLTIEYGEWLAAQVDEWGFRCRLVHGDTPDREGTFEAFNRREFPVLVVNRVMRRGVNVPAIEVWIQWDPTKDETSIVQAAIGRGTRTDGVNTSFTIEDFMDSGGGALELNSLERVRMYRHPDHGARVRFNYPADPEGRAV